MDINTKEPPLLISNTLNLFQSNNTTAEKFDVKDIDKNLILNVCRICFRIKHEMYQIEFDGEQHIPCLFEYLTCLVMESSDIYPKTICKSCYENLRKASEIRKLFIDSFEELKQFLMQPNIKDIESECIDSDFQYDASEEQIVTIEDIQTTETDIEIIQNFKECENNVPVENIKSKIRKSRTLQKPHECEYCNEGFMKKSSLGVHVRIKHTKEKIYNCDKCEKSYSVFRDLNRHKKTHSEKYTCPHCKKDFSFRQSYKTHLEIHKRKDGKNSKCEVCGQYFKDEKLKIRHIKSNHTNEEYTCDHCQKIFSHITKLTQHMKCHRSYDEKSFKCSLCPKRFNFSHHLANHERFHSGSRPFICSICGNRFTQSHFLTVHLRQHDKSSSYKCKICTKIFFSEWRLKRHEQSHKGEKIFLCTKCGKQFTMNSSLKRHIEKNHSEESNREENLCRVCNITFDNESDFSQHMITHSLIKSNCKFLCNICNVEFELESLLEAHMKTHSNKKKVFICEICNLSYNHSEHLRSHISECHSNPNELENNVYAEVKLKSYLCIYCKKQFDTTTQLNMHKKIHKKPKPQRDLQTFSSTNLINRMVIVTETPETIYLQKSDTQILLFDDN